MNKYFSAIILSVTAATALGLAFAAVAQENLNYAPFMPAVSWQNQELFLNRAESVNAASGVSLDVKVIPAQTLGKSPQGYDKAVNGITDIARTVQGYPDRCGSLFISLLAVLSKALQ